MSSPDRPPHMRRHEILTRRVHTIAPLVGGWGRQSRPQKIVFCILLRALRARNKIQKEMILEGLRPSKPPSCYKEMILEGLRPSKPPSCYKETILEGLRPSKPPSC